METLFVILFLILFSFIIPKLKCNKVDKFKVPNTKAVIVSKNGKNGILTNITKSVMIPKTNKKAFLFDKNSSLVIPDLNLNQ